MVATNDMRTCIIRGTPVVATLVDCHDNITLNRSQDLCWNKIIIYWYWQKPFAAFCQLYSYHENDISGLELDLHWKKVTLTKTQYLNQFLSVHSISTQNMMFLITKHFEETSVTCTFAGLAFQPQPPSWILFSTLETLPQRWVELW